MKITAILSLLSLLILLNSHQIMAQRSMLDNSISLQVRELLTDDNTYCIVASSNSYLSKESGTFRSDHFSIFTTELPGVKEIKRGTYIKLEPPANGFEEKVTEGNWFYFGNTSISYSLSGVPFNMDISGKTHSNIQVTLLHRGIIVDNYKELSVWSHEKYSTAEQLCNESFSMEEVVNE